MKKILNLTLALALGLGVTSCNDYLEVSSPSVVTEDFVFSNGTTARAALEGAYEQWRATANSYVFGAGLFYACDIAGSDIERHPEAYSAQAPRHIPECFYENGTKAGSYTLLSYDKEGTSGAYGNLFAVISQANAVITAMENSASFEENVTKAEKPNTISQLYGEALALRATAYRELIKYYGDVPFVDEFGVAGSGLTSRDSIYDVIINGLVDIEDLMYAVGEMPGVDKTDKHYFSRTYVDGLIGRMALEAAGFQTRRVNDKYVTYTDGSGNALTFETKGTENNNAQYGRRSDYKNFLETARIFFKKAIENAGTVTFYSTDPRKDDARSYNNPYQYFFQQMMGDDAAYADESIYEYPMQQNVTSDERTYSSGRPSDGGSKNAYPCKDYGQCRINPAYYYGIFAPNDKRRDVAVCVTGSDGKGFEKLISFTPGSKASGGGLACNKWDENRQSAPNVLAQRKSGINGPYMRMSEIYLGYAEACELTGDHINARYYLDMVRDRAFNAGEANTEAFIAECGNLYPESGYTALYKAIIEERGFEFAGEGDRRWTLIRTGILPEAIKRIKELTTKMIDGLEANGYYEFENGNVISNYVWTKAVDAKAEIGYRLTAQCPAGQEDDPILYPGWRGQNDDWSTFGCSYSKTTTNLAIKGMFKKLSPTEIADLEAAGYAKADWASNIVAKRDEYDKYLFYQYDYKSTPIYLWPLTPNTLATGGYENGYGFKNTAD